MERGFINAGGEYLKGLFGTATDGDVNVEKKLKAFKMQTSMLNKEYKGILSNMDVNHKIIRKIDGSLKKIILSQQKIPNMIVLGEVTILLNEVNIFGQDKRINKYNCSIDVP